MFVGVGGTEVGLVDSPGGVRVKITRVLVAVGEGVKVKVGVGDEVCVGVGVFVGIYCAKSWAVSAAAVFKSENARFTKSPGATEMGC